MIDFNNMINKVLVGRKIIKDAVMLSIIGSILYAQDSLRNASEKTISYTAQTLSDLIKKTESKEFYHIFNSIGLWDRFIYYPEDANISFENGWFDISHESSESAAIFIKYMNYKEVLSYIYAPIPTQFEQKENNFTLIKLALAKGDINNPEDLILVVIGGGYTELFNNYIGLLAVVDLKTQTQRLEYRTIDNWTPYGSLSVSTTNNKVVVSFNDITISIDNYSINPDIFLLEIWHSLPFNTENRAKIHDILLR